MVNKIMIDMMLLKECGIDAWCLRDESVFPKFNFPNRQLYKFLKTYSLSEKFDALILLSKNVNNYQLLSNFCQAMFGLNSRFLFAYKSSKGDDLYALIKQANVNKIISFVDIQKDTLNFDHNVLIFNDIDFEFLGNNRKYKKQVMLDVNRISVSTIGT